MQFNWTSFHFIATECSCDFTVKALINPMKSKNRVLVDDFIMLFDLVFG
jgi:hypothetical protein